MAKYKINKELKGIEISFEKKPAAATITALKAAGFRWHNIKKLWYAKETAERLTLVKAIAGEAEEAPAADPAPVKKLDVINLNDLGSNRPSLYGSELAKAIRDDLKRRGVSGVTVRTRKITYDTGIIVTIKATAEDFASIEELKERYSYSSFVFDVESRNGVFDGSRWIYDNTWEGMTEEEKEAAYINTLIYRIKHCSSFSVHWTERDRYPELTTAFYNKCLAVFKIANQWNYDHSDSMTDYFDVGYYLDIDIKSPEDLAPRENMTEEEKAAYKAEQEQKEAEREEAAARWKAEQEAAQKAAAEAEKRRKENREIIEKGVSIEDLAEGEALYISNLIGGIGKESTLQELNEELRESVFQDAVVTRIVKMSPEAFAAFSELLLDDFDFLSGKGGTATNDTRLQDVNNLYSMTEEQRESVKWFINDAVAIYVDDVLQLVSDPEGYSYSQYTYKPTPDSVITNAKQETQKQEEDSKSLNPFYFPAPIEEQAEAIKAGDQITIYQCDGWILNNIYCASGTVASVAPGSYAQYNGIYISFTNGKKSFIRNGKKCLIYKGIKEALPDSVTREQINERMTMLYNSDVLFVNTLAYYESLGEKPILDTIQR